MAFTRKFWKRGDKLNAKELNRIEEGIAGNNNSVKTIEIDIEDREELNSEGQTEFNVIKVYQSQEILNQIFTSNDINLEMKINYSRKMNLEEGQPPINAHEIWKLPLVTLTHIIINEATGDSSTLYLFGNNVPILDGDIVYIAVNVVKDGSDWNFSVVQLKE